MVFIESQLTSENFHLFARSRTAKELGLICYKCGREFSLGDVIISHGRSNRRHYYCRSCAKQLYLYPAWWFENALSPSTV